MDRLDEYITGNYGEDQFREYYWGDYPRIQLGPYRLWAWDRIMLTIYGYNLYYPVWHERSFTHQHFWRIALPSYRKRAWKRAMASKWRQRKRGYHDDDKWWRPASGILIDQCARIFGDR